MGVSILHLTDIHFALNRQTAVMAAIRQEFMSDLRYLLESLGPVDLIIFSGDLAYSGEFDQYVVAERFFQELGQVLLDKTGRAPALFSVPGNHDVDRKELGLAALPKMLERMWDDVEYDFWGADADGLRQLVRDGFGAYSAWWQSPGLPTGSSSIEGLLPGDHVASLQVGDGTLGLLGLNTSVRHLSDRVVEGDLSVTETQVARACGGDIVQWASRHDLCILTTHHPSSWLDAGSRSLMGELLFTGHGAFRFHLTGHLHVPEASVGDRLATSEYERLQGRSLFGIDALPNGQARSHGYQIVEFNDALTEFRLWPRAAARTAGGAWRLSADAAFGLPKGSDHTLWRPVGGSLLGTATRRPQPLQSSPAMNVTPTPAPDALGESNQQEILKRLLRDVATGTVRLVLGGDLSSTCPSQPLVDDGLAGIEALKMALYGFALGPSIEGPSTDRLNELLRLAQRMRRKEVRAALTVAGTDLSDKWNAVRLDILDGPWPAIIDLWIADDGTRIGKSSSSATARSISIASDEFTLDDRIVLLKMNGSSHQPDIVTFETPAVDPPTSNRRMWFQRLSIDFVRNPVLYLADSVTDLGMWEYIELRGSGACSQLNVPTAYIVCPALTRIQAATLQLYKVEWIQDDIGNFLNTVLRPSNQAVATGKQLLLGRLEAEQEIRSPLQTVRDLRNVGEGGGADVLLGREPGWADVVRGFTFRLAAVDDIRQRITQATSRIVLVHGTAGSGKSTALMHVALELDASGLSVLWIDRSTNLRVGEILDRIKVVSPDYVVVDNVDIYGVFGARAADVLAKVSRSATVIAAVRTNQLDRLEAAADSTQIRMPDLSQSDVWAILSALESRGLLGKLRGMAAADRYQQLAKESGRQLLVALMQATKGRRFAEILEDEYSELEGLQQLAYVLACIVSALNEEGIAERELEMAAGGYGAAARRATEVLLNARLLVLHGDGLVSPRHRVIGEAVLAAVQRKGELADAILSLLQVIVVSAKSTKDTSRRDRRLLVRLINHDQLAKFGLELAEVRRLYASVQGDLYDDFHFWLQRGTYELERGELEYALNYLDQARLVEGGHDDPYVLTEFSLARLRAAAATTDRASAVGLGEEALGDLGRVIRVQGVKSPHTVVVLATAGLDWIERADVAGDVRIRYAREAGELLTLVQAVADESDYAARILHQATKRLSTLMG